VIVPTNDLAVDVRTLDKAQTLLAKNGGKEGKIIKASTVTITVIQNHSIRETYLTLLFIVDADQR
jgi:hypothetical protein